jgi:hypothetical protein
MTNLESMATDDAQQTAVLGKNSSGGSVVEGIDRRRKKSRARLYAKRRLARNRSVWIFCVEQAPSTDEVLDGGHSAWP